MDAEKNTFVKLLADIIDLPVEFRLPVLRFYADFASPSLEIENIVAGNLMGAFAFLEEIILPAGAHVFHALSRHLPDLILSERFLHKPEGQALENLVNMLSVLSHEYNKSAFIFLSDFTCQLYAIGTADFYIQEIYTRLTA